MAQTNPERREVNARIVYWGVKGAGKTTNLKTIHAKLRPDHRGPLREVRTRRDPNVCYHVLPIELGELAGARTRIQVIAVPGDPAHASIRKRLLDQVDGIVFVIDSHRSRLDENIASFEELGRALGAYDRSLGEIPLVIQYNRRDRSDPFAMEELHRKLDLRGTPAFEAVASEGTGVLATLTTISKRVIRALREGGLAGAGGGQRPQVAELPEMAPAPSEADSFHAAVPESEAAGAFGLEEASLAVGDQAEDQAAADSGRTQMFLDASWEEAKAGAAAEAKPTPAGDWSIVSVGRARAIGRRSVEVPLILRAGEESDVRLRLTLRIGPFTDDGED